MLRLPLESNGNCDCAIAGAMLIAATVAAPTILVTLDDLVLPFASSETATQVHKVAFQTTL